MGTFLRNARRRPRSALRRQKQRAKLAFVSALRLASKFGFSRKFRALGRPLHELTALWNKRQYAGSQQIETGTAIHLAFDQL
jgi:hypothetical protein